jgi:hypothetical protein
MKRKLMPLVFIVLGFVGTMLPFASFTIDGSKGSDPMVAALAQELAQEVANEAPSSANAWSYKEGHQKVGVVVIVPLIAVGVFAAMIAATRLGRGLSIPLLILGIIGTGLAALVIAGRRDEASFDGIRFAMRPQLGLYLITAGLLGATAMGLLGTIRPDPKRA